MARVAFYGWINGTTPEETAPDIYQIIHPNTRASKTVADACTDGNWLNDIKKPRTMN
jgi:hypothetical protein